MRSSSLISGLGSKMAAEPGQQDGSEASGGWPPRFRGGDPRHPVLPSCSPGLTSLVFQFNIEIMRNPCQKNMTIRAWTLAGVQGTGFQETGRSRLYNGRPDCYWAFPIAIGRSRLPIGRSRKFNGRSRLSIGRSRLPIGRSRLSIGRSRKIGHR